MTPIVHEMRSGARLVCLRESSDERGGVIEFELQEIGVPPITRELVVASHVDVLRGLHFQDAPAPLTKIVHCMQGRVLEAVVDMRTGEADWLTLLDCKQALIVPPWCAHGYRVISTEGALVHYSFDGPRSIDHERAIRWDSAGVNWPKTDTPILSLRDAEAPTLKEVMQGTRWTQ